MLRQCFVFSVFVLGAAGMTFGQVCDSGVGRACDAPACDSGCGSGGLFSRMGGGFFRRGCDQSCGQSCDQGCYQGCGVDSGCATGCRPGGRLLGLIPRVNMDLSRCGKCLPGYRSIFGGWVDVDDDGTQAQLYSNDGWLLGTARGWYLNPCTRFELEGAWRNNTTDRTPSGGLIGRINNYSTMLNLLRDFNAGNGVNFYGGGGIGFARQDGDFSDGGGTFYEIDDWAFAYQGIAGVSMQATQTADLFVEYRYYGNTETDVDLVGGGTVDNFGYDSNNIVLGIRINR